MTELAREEMDAVTQQFKDYRTVNQDQIDKLYNIRSDNLLSGDKLNKNVRKVVNKLAQFGNLLSWFNWCCKL